MVKHASSFRRLRARLRRVAPRGGARGRVHQSVRAKPQIERLIDDPRVKGVALTGSDAAGAIVAARSGKALKKLDDGARGSDPFIVLEDADLDRRGQGGAVGTLPQRRPVCVATKRLIRARTAGDRFLGKPRRRWTACGWETLSTRRRRCAPLLDEALDPRLIDQVGVGSEGCPDPAGRKARGGKGRIHAATLLTDIAPGSGHTRSAFGAVALFFRVPDETRRFARPNDNPFGSADGVTRDVFAQRVGGGSRAHGGHQSRTWTAPELPFGRIKRRGTDASSRTSGSVEFVNAQADPGSRNVDAALLKERPQPRSSSSTRLDLGHKPSLDAL